MNALLTIILLISTILYIIVGGFIIRVLESKHETATHTEISRRLDQTVLQFLCMIFIYLFIYFSTDIDNTSNTNKNNKIPAKDRKAPEGTLTSTLINTI